MHHLTHKAVMPSAVKQDISNAGCSCLLNRPNNHPNICFVLLFVYLKGQFDTVSQNAAIHVDARWIAENTSVLGEGCRSGVAGDTHKHSLCRLKGFEGRRPVSVAHLAGQ